MLSVYNYKSLSIKKLVNMFLIMVSYTKCDHLNFCIVEFYGQ